MDSGYCPNCGSVTGDMHDQTLCKECLEKNHITFKSGKIDYISCLLCEEWKFGKQYVDIMIPLAKGIPPEEIGEINKRLTELFRSVEAPIVLYTGGGEDQLHLKFICTREPLEK